jgi:SH3 domain-containing YSC84-like protein 1
MSDNKKEEPEVRPNPTTMEGMIWNANHVLEWALSPKINGMPKRLFRDCIGIVIMHSVQLGFILSGATATGILFKRKMDGSSPGWSPPCAVGMTGLGFGILIGISASDLIVFIFDELTLDTMLTKHGAKLGSQFEATIGRAGFADFELSKEGWGPTFTLAYSKGAFAGIALKGSAVGAREFVNNKFYSANVSPKDIVEGNVTVPASQITMLQEVYDKLNKCLEGETAEPTPEEEEKKKAAKAVADKEHEEIQNSSEVVPVDAVQEAAKESA